MRAPARASLCGAALRPIAQDGEGLRQGWQIPSGRPWGEGEGERGVPDLGGGKRFFLKKKAAFVYIRYDEYNRLVYIRYNVYNRPPPLWRGRIIIEAPIFCI